jgi:glycosyltransferase involved in cell wall biosynthesis
MARAETDRVNMTGPLVTVGIPVYRGQDVLPVTLECVRTQTYPNLDVLISVDGPDDAAVEACRPFLSDSRFRLQVQPERLGWAGNTDWTMRNRRGEFYLYQQQDDQITPDYIAGLVEAATRWPQATICYTVMEFSGRENLTVRQKPNLARDPIGRALAHLESMNSGPLRGLVRGSALDATVGLRLNEYEGFGSEHAFMVQLALAGEFRYVPGPTYYKRLHPHNLHLKWLGWPQDKKRAAWALLGAWMIEAIVPAGSTPAARRKLFDTVLERFLIARNRIVPWALGRLGGWAVDRRRLMFPDVDNRDLAARAAMLRAILERSRSEGRFDPADFLESNWQTIEDAARRRFGVAGY